MNIQGKKISKSRLKFIDHRETYGRNVIAKFVKGLKIGNCLDIGCGYGNDLNTVKEICGNIRLYGIDYFDNNKNTLNDNGIELKTLNIENEALPFGDETIDLVIANQVFEHVKEVFWVNNEIFRCLKVGGHVIIGVPNVLSLHNRIGMLFGMHPTSSKLLSAHIRSLSANDTKLFYNCICGNSINILDVRGSQFYPLPVFASRILSRLIPNMAYSIFLKIRKERSYNQEFIKYLQSNVIETNYFTGK